MPQSHTNNAFDCVNPLTWTTGFFSYMLTLYTWLSRYLTIPIFQLLRIILRVAHPRLTIFNCLYFLPLCFLCARKNVGQASTDWCCAQTRSRASFLANLYARCSVTESHFQLSSSVTLHMLSRILIFYETEEIKQNHLI